MKRIIVCAVLALMPLAVGAQTYNVNLDGDVGTGFATIMISGDTVDYTIISSGFDPAPNSAVVTDGTDTLDLQTDFAGTGTATGSVSSAMAGDITASPSAWILEVSNGTDTLSGSLGTGPSPATTLYFAVASSNFGQAGTRFLTDGRLINLSGEMATVDIEYYTSGAAGNTAPTDTETITIDAGEETLLNDMVANLFGVTNGKGAICMRADRSITAFARIYNDQTDLDPSGGTLGLAMIGLREDQASRSGVLPFMSNQDSATGAGFRSNIGWFNPGSGAIQLTLQAYDAVTGALIGEVTRTVNGLAQEQFNAGSSQLWPALSTYDDFYATYTASGDIFLYTSVVDNVNGDGTFFTAVLLR